MRPEQLRGTGTLGINGETYPGIGYLMQITRTDDQLLGKGYLTGSEQDLERASEFGAGELQLRNGEVIEITIGPIDRGATTATFTYSGPRYDND
jgi:hypothetical protein